MRIRQKIEATMILDSNCFSLSTVTSLFSITKTLVVEDCVDVIFTKLKQTNKIKSAISDPLYNLHSKAVHLLDSSASHVMLMDF